MFLSKRFRKNVILFHCSLYEGVQHKLAFEHLTTLHANFLAKYEC